MAVVTDQLGGTVNSIARFGDAVTPEQYGAQGDGASDDTAALHDAVATGRPVFCPNSYLVDDPPVLATSGQRVFGRSKTLSTISVTAAGIDLFTVGDDASLYDLDFSDIRLVCGASAGHVFNQAQGLGKSSFRRVAVVQNNPARSLWNGDGEIYIDNHWSEFDLQHVLTATVPGFDFRNGDGGVNSNSWERGRCTYSGDFFFSFENTGASSYLYDNLLRSINFEVCLGGAVRGLGVDNLRCIDLLNYDMAVSGASTKDFVYLDDSTNVSPLKSRHCHIEGIYRRSGSLGVGLNDIKLVSGGVDDCQIIGGDSATLAGFTVDLGSNLGILVIQPRNWTPSNKHATAVIVCAFPSSGGGSFAEIAGAKWLAGAGTPEGSVTAAIGSIYSRNDGGAATSFYVKESGAGNTGWVAK